MKTAEAVAIEQDVRGSRCDVSNRGMRAGVSHACKLGKVQIDRERENDNREDVMMKPQRG